LKPQQAVASLPVTLSTATVPPEVSPEQQAPLLVSLSQKPPATQALLSAQAVWQAVAPQTNGLQSVVVPRQAPAPSQAEGSIWV